MPTRSWSVTAADVRERDGRREVVLDEMVGDEERRVAECLGLACELGELLTRPTLAAGDAEAKSAIVHRATLQLRPQRRPVDPQPSVPLAESSSAATSRHAMSCTRWITSCAMRSP